jgi:hypothetical protein
MNKTLRQEIKQFVEDMKQQEAGLIKKAGETVMEMPDEEIFNKPQNQTFNYGSMVQTESQSVTEKQIFLHRLKSKLAIIQEYRNELENILINCPEPKPAPILMATQPHNFIMTATQPPPYERKCRCGKVFYCKNECGDSYRLKYANDCNCSECLKRLKIVPDENYQCPARFPPQTNGSRNLIKKIAQKYAQTPTNKNIVVAKKADKEPPTPQPKIMLQFASAQSRKKVAQMMQKPTAKKVK